MRPRLVALTDLERFPQPAPALARLCALARPGSVAVVLRDKQAALTTRLQLGRALRDLTASSGQLLLVSDRVDLALELSADGVHLPARGLLPSQVERLFPAALVSRAHHDADGLPPGELERCAFLLVSPAFEERKGRVALGPRGLAERISLLAGLAPGVALLALGGVDSQSARSALDAGAHGVASIGSAHDRAEQLGLVECLQIGR